MLCGISTKNSVVKSLTSLNKSTVLSKENRAQLDNRINFLRRYNTANNDIFNSIYNSSNFQNLNINLIIINLHNNTEFINNLQHKLNKYKLESTTVTLLNDQNNHSSDTATNNTNTYIDDIKNMLSIKSIPFTDHNILEVGLGIILSNCHCYIQDQNKKLSNDDYNKLVDIYTTNSLIKVNKDKLISITQDNTKILYTLFIDDNLDSRTNTVTPENIFNILDTLLPYKNIGLLSYEQVDITNNTITKSNILQQLERDKNLYNQIPTYTYSEYHNYEILYNGILPFIIYGINNKLHLGLW